MTRRAHPASSGALDELTAAVRYFADDSLAMARLDELVAEARR